MYDSDKILKTFTIEKLFFWLYFSKPFMYKPNLLGIKLIRSISINSSNLGTYTYINFNVLK